MEYYLEGFSVPGFDSETKASIISAQTLARRFAHIKIKQQDYWGASFWGAWVPNSILAIGSTLYSIPGSPPTGPVGRKCVDKTEAFITPAIFNADFRLVDVHINSSGEIDKFKVKESL